MTLYLTTILNLHVVKKTQFQQSWFVDESSVSDVMSIKLMAVYLLLKAP